MQDNAVLSGKKYFVKWQPKAGWISVQFMLGGPILNILVPHDGQTPWVAGFPFFMVMALAFFISFLARHLTQYPSMVTASYMLFALTINHARL